MAISRRDVCFVLSGLLPAATCMFAADGSSVPSGTFPFDQLPIHVANNAQIRPVLKGNMAIGESLEVHETTLPPGSMPHAPHHHLHSEMWPIREGTVELMINGKSHLLGPGSGGFVHSNEEHGVRKLERPRRHVSFWLPGRARDCDSGEPSCWRCPFGCFDSL